MISKEKVKLWIPRIAFLAGLGFIIILGLFWPLKFNSYSNLTVASTTLIYLFLTYEILRSTNDSVDRPYLNIGFIITNKLDADFIKKYDKSLRRTDRFGQLEQEATGNPDGLLNRDIVFARIENVGTGGAIETLFHTTYNKRNLREIGEGTKNINIGVVKKEDIIMDIVDVYESPSSADDFFKIKNCYVEFLEVNTRRKIKNNFSKSVSATNYGTPQLKFSPKED